MSRGSARGLALALGLLAVLDLAVAALLGDRDLGVLGAALLLAALVLARSRLADTATNLVLAAAVTASLLLAGRAMAMVHLMASRFQFIPAGPPLAVPDPRLGHRLIPNLTSPYRTNADGFRGPALPPLVAPGQWRLVALGDSVTFGWREFDESATYPAVLEALLRGRHPGRPIHVLNAGVPSYTSLQAARLARDQLASWRPDILLVGLGWNDISYAYEPDWSPLLPIEKPANRVPALFRLSPRKTPVANPAAPAEFGKNLAAIVESSRAVGAEAVLLNLPTVLSTARTTTERALALRFADADLAPFQAEVDRLCAAGVPCFTQAFPVRETGKERYFIDHCHFSKVGARELARRLAPALDALAPKEPHGERKDAARRPVPKPAS